MPHRDEQLWSQSDIGDTPLAKAVSRGTGKGKKNVPKGTPTTASSTSPTDPVIPYNLDSQEQWSLRARQSQSPAPAGYSQTTDKGYDVEAMRLNTMRRELALRFANGVLSTGSVKMPFFVTGVGIDWALAGTTAQSRLTRDFYPHNFTQPSFTVAGISLNQGDYAELVEFMHQAQHDALDSSRSLVQLDIVPSAGALNGGRPATVGGRPMRGVRTKSAITAIGTRNLPNQTIRGHHKPITCQGYVSSMVRKHQKGVYVPTWEFSFTVAHMINGPYQEELVTLAAQKNWVSLLKSVSLFQTQWYVQTDKASIDWVRQNANTIFNVTQTAGTGGGGITSNSGPGSAVGTWWKVKASSELASSGTGWTELSSNGNGAGAAGHTQSPNCQGGSVGACDFATLGKAFPHGTMLRILNPANGKSGVFPLTDVGNGSSFGPAIGLTPAVQAAIGWGGGEVQIQLADGSPLSVVSGFGTKI